MLLKTFTSIALPHCTANFVIRKPMITESSSRNTMSQFNFAVLYMDFVQTRGLISLIDDNHVDKYQAQK